MIEIKPLHHCNAVIAIPGSKSYTHRALILSSLAGGGSHLIHALRCEDTERTAQALLKFGVEIFWEGDDVRVLGTGGKYQASEDRIDVGNSGTSMRFLTALAALRKGTTLLDGNERMRKRPIGELLKGLRELGVPCLFPKRKRLPAGSCGVRGTQRWHSEDQGGRKQPVPFRPPDGGALRPE